ncbi:hypothetical protein LTR70_009036 [Exophiala xenobiotica]|uniref:Uncharacterized protein n=1 Tax=Lithohypha guttulata TaxID=1690604 RepID=A0ABR0JZA0_9EURO|nr:hypothetical protein LTR24_008733 [Lithohypha guttulata]KAK5311086.1 hypothetical protein LTR70_009036 [Exophiala xenobiotica]
MNGGQDDGLYAQASTQPAILSLLGLPAEIRVMILKYLLCSEDPDQCLTDLPQVVEDRLLEGLLTDSDGEEEDGQDTDDEYTIGGDGEHSYHVHLPTDGSVEAGQGRLCGWLRRLANCVHQTHPSTSTISPSISNVILDDKPRLSSPQDPSASKCVLGLHPQILAACRMLYAEGQHILYEHKIVKVTYFADENIKPRAYVLGESSVEEAMKKYPALKQIKRWAVGIFSDCEQRIYNYEFEDPGGYRLWSSRLFIDIAALLSVSDMEYLDIEVAYLPGPDSPPDNDYDLFWFEMFCNPFRVLRSWECSVSIPTHKGRDLERTIEEHIRSDRPMLEPWTFFDRDLEPLFNDVHAIADLLCWDGQKLVQKEIQQHCQIPQFDQIEAAEDLLESIRDAVYGWDTDVFFIEARNLLRLIQTYLPKVLAYLEKEEHARDKPIPPYKASDEHHPEPRGEMEVQMEAGEGLVTEQAGDAERDSIVREKTRITILSIKAFELFRWLK